MLPDQQLIPTSAPSWPAQGSRGLGAEARPRGTEPQAVEVTPGEPLKDVYLGISGVLHPSASLYKFIRGCSPWSDGHTVYESAPVLEAALAAWPDAKIVLTSTRPWAKGLEPVLGRLGPNLAARVAGFTYENLTTKVRVGPRQLSFSSNGYWRLMKSEIVRYHVQWMRPHAWIAIDDETISWTPEEWRDHVVAVDGCEGLREPRAQDRLMTLLVGNFGAPNAT